MSDVTIHPFHLVAHRDVPARGVHVAQSVTNVNFLEGPVGMVFVRQPQLRLTIPWGEHVKYALAIEDVSQSDSNIDIPFSGVDDHRVPDFVARLRYELPSSHVQFSSVLRELGFHSRVMPSQNVIGWGISLSGAWQWTASEQFYGQATFGEGVARYLEDLSGTRSDAALDIHGNLVALPAVGVVVGWRHLWSNDLQSNLIFGCAEISNSVGQSPGAFHKSEYVAGNVIWSPIINMALGCEAMWGNRTDKDRAYGEAVRLQFTTTLSF